MNVLMNMRRRLGGWLPDPAPDEGDEAPMSEFSLDETKFVPAPKSFRYSNLANNFSTKRGVLYRFRSGQGWMRYVDPDYVYSINSYARVVRAPKASR